ncbi:MAG: EAL domain-containing protein [Spirochaeta sp.]|nr:EAL domain-containing protein [Spirochaeta sp.]
MGDAYQTIVDLSRDYITLIDRDYHYQLVNDSYCRQLGKSKGELLGRSVEEVWGTERFHEYILPKITACLGGEAVEYIDTFVFGALQKHMRVNFHPYRENGNEITHVLVFSQDITVQSETEARLADYEYRDRLTGLYNRRTLEITLAQQLSQAGRTAPTANRVLFFVSLHNFKSINRTSGHQIGDVLLENTAIRVTECLRSSDFVFRFNSTNFVVLLTEIERVADATMPAEKICDAVAVPYRFQAGEIAITAHIGISVFPTDTHDPNTLVQQANSACVEAEERGFSFLFYDRELHERALQRSQLYSELRQAFEAHEFRLVYQPLADIRGKQPRLIGAEALIRWEHPSRGLLQPVDFLGLAEETLVVRSVDKWVLFNVCLALKELQAEFPDVVLSANMSAVGFMDPELPEIVRAALSAAGSPNPHGLRLELTESMSIQEDPALLPARVAALEEAGVLLWIDDFGIGQSSLALLKSLPAHGVKIDRSFVEGIADSEREQRYLAGIIQGVRARDKEIILEGVSGQGELDIARSMGCSIVQGYFFGRPLQFERLRELLGDEL